MRLSKFLEAEQAKERIMKVQDLVEDSKQIAAPSVDNSVKKKMEKPAVGRKYGCTDTSKPKKFKPEQLSRLADAMYAAQEAGLDPKDVFALAPDSMKMEWNYSKWVYVE